MHWEQEHNGDKGSQSRDPCGRGLSLGSLFSYLSKSAVGMPVGVLVGFGAFS